MSTYLRGNSDPDPVILIRASSTIKDLEPDMDPTSLKYKIRIRHSVCLSTTNLPKHLPILESICLSVLCCALSEEEWRQQSLFTSSVPFQLTYSRTNLVI